MKAKKEHTKEMQFGTNDNIFFAATVPMELHKIATWLAP